MVKIVVQRTSRVHHEFAVSHYHNTDCERHFRRLRTQRRTERLTGVGQIDEVEEPNGIDSERYLGFPLMDDPNGPSEEAGMNA